MKRWVAFVTVFLLVFTAHGAVAAVCEPIEEEITLRYELANNIKVDLTISSSGLATCTGKLTAKASADTCKASLALKQKQGRKWVTLETWDGPAGKGSKGCSVKGTQQVAPGYSYKVVLTGTVTSPSGSTEPVSRSSKVNTY